MTPNEIIEALDCPPKVYQRRALQAAMDQRDGIVPLLLQHLQDFLASPESHTPPEYDSFFPIYAVFILAHHRVREAHSMLVELASLPGELPFDLLGDVITEGFPAVLWNTSGGDSSDIERLIENREANQYCRWSAVTALTYGVATGELSRGEVVGFLQGLFTGEEAAWDEPGVWSGAACALLDLWPGDSVEVLRGAFKDGLVEPIQTNEGDLEIALERGKEVTLGRLEQHARRQLSRTPHDHLEWWACFHDESGPPAGERQTPKPRRPRKCAKMARRKQGKASRRKNRAKRKR